MRNSEELKQEFTADLYNERLQEIYLDSSVLTHQKQRYSRLIDQYEAVFGAGAVEIFSAPGRSEICGNHTDHQHGCVLAASINLDTIAAAGRTNDGIVHVVSDGYEMVTLDASDLALRREETATTAGLIRGVLKGLQDRGYAIGGFKTYIASDVLIGSGLSSSASYETIIGSIISGLYNQMKIDPVVIAKVGQYAENVYFGKPCGLMDQMACSVGGMIQIDFEQPDQPVVSKVETDFEKYEHSLCIVDTHGSHADLTQDYAAIPIEMKQVAAFFGQQHLRQVNPQDFYHSLPQLRAAVSDRAALRAFHFFNEQVRVAKAAEALKNDDFKAFLQQIKESGDSSFKFLQNIYSSHDLENQNMSVALAVSESILASHGVCRVHGGGFAGTIQAFVENAFVENYRSQMEAVFGSGSCHVLQIRPLGGVRVVG